MIGLKIIMIHTCIMQSIHGIPKSGLPVPPKPSLPTPKQTCQSTCKGNNLIVFDDASLENCTCVASTSTFSLLAKSTGEPLSLSSTKTGYVTLGTALNDPQKIIFQTDSTLNINVQGQVLMFNPKGELMLGNVHDLYRLANFMTPIIGDHSSYKLYYGQMELSKALKLEDENSPSVESFYLIKEEKGSATQGVDLKKVPAQCPKSCNGAYNFPIFQSLADLTSTACKCHPVDWTATGPDSKTKLYIADQDGNVLSSDNNRTVYLGNDPSKFLVFNPTSIQFPADDQTNYPFLSLSIAPGPKGKRLYLNMGDSLCLSSNAQDSEAHVALVYTQSMRGVYLAANGTLVDNNLQFTVPYDNYPISFAGAGQFMIVKV